jgi:predicted dehydrogenase
MKPRIGCLGLGWIGRHRLQALNASGLVDITHLWDADAIALTAAAALVPAARCASGIDELFDTGLDGLVIATPSALHTSETMRALDRGLAVFCQKPLARSAAETACIVELARQRDRLLHVDLSYRHVRAFEALVTCVERGAAGTPHAIDLTFHNAYGPDKLWYYARELSGGGCVTDLGAHLIDLLLRLSGPELPSVVASQLFSGCSAWTPESSAVEDLAIVQLRTCSGAAVRLACSWRLPAGCDAVIDATVYGPTTGFRAHNVNGSFYDFAAERLERGQAHVLVSPPDEWSGRAVVEWARRLASSPAFDPACERYIGVAQVVDDIYAATAAPAPRRVAEVAAASTATRPALNVRVAGRVRWYAPDTA